MAEFELAARVYFEDTDFSGLVYHARYLHFLERGRTEALRAAGFDHAGLMAREDPMMFAVRRMAIDWIAPARMDDLLTVRTRFFGGRGARVEARQTIERDAARLVEATSELVCLTPSARPRRVPPEVAAAFAAMDDAGPDDWADDGAD
ncbi:MAG: YbgC/FadM family acyl-CoA thioesterase [Parvularculaceae bacterium]